MDNQDFHRIRVGIRTGNLKQPALSTFVLNKFTPTEVMSIPIIFKNIQALVEHFQEPEPLPPSEVKL